MESKDERTPPEPARPPEQRPAPRKRFRIEKVEERIAPRAGRSSSGNTGAGDPYIPSGVY